MPKDSKIRRRSHSRVERIAVGRTRKILGELADQFRTKLTDDRDPTPMSELDSEVTERIIRALKDPATAKIIVKELSGEGLRFYLAALDNPSLSAPSSDEIIARVLENSLS